MLEKLGANHQKTQSSCMGPISDSDKTLGMTWIKTIESFH